MTLHSLPAGGARQSTYSSAARMSRVVENEPSAAIGTDAAPGSGLLVTHRAVPVAPDRSTPPDARGGRRVGPLSTQTAT